MSALQKIGLKFVITLSIFAFFSFFPGKSFTSVPDNMNLNPQSDTVFQNETREKTAGKGFNPGEMIMEHVLDCHEWHIMEIAGHELTVPLPVILFSEGRLYCFLSSKFHNETHTYQGFKLEQEGANKGKIVRLNTDKSEGEGSRVYDLSITKTVLAIFISSFLLIWIFVSVARSYRRNPKKAPHGLQSLLEPLILFIRDEVAKNSIGEKKYEKFLPYLLTLFFFIFFNNLFGIIPFFPGGANVTGNITITLVMAVCTFILTTINGNKHYWIEIINTPGVPWWLKFPLPLMPIVEIIGIITKPFVLMIRLFANMTAGHIIVLGFVSLIFIFGEISYALGLGISTVSVAFMIFMDLLELLVAFIQAYVFTLLSALYFGLATAEPEHH